MAGSKGGSGNGGDSAAFYSVGYHSRLCQPGPAHQRQRAVRQRGKIGCRGQGIGVGLFVQMAEPCKLCAHVGRLAAVAVNGKWGMIDTAGNTVIPFRSRDGVHRPQSQNDTKGKLYLVPQSFAELYGFLREFPWR